MARTGTKRKRKEREGRTAAEVEQGKRQSATEQKLLGTSVTKDVADESIFTIDRKGESKDALDKQFRGQALHQRRAAKRARRQAPKERKSEAGVRPLQTGEEKVKFVGKKKKVGVGLVEKQIMAKRKFDKPEGHVGNRSAVVREMLQKKGEKADVWSTAQEAEDQDAGTELFEQKGIAQRRKVLEEKVHSVHRAAQPIIHPDSGLSVNPSHSDHQDALGEAVASIVRKDDDKRWDEKKMSYDPAILLESTEGEVADTGMKLDDNMSESDSESEPDAVATKQGAPERKTRAQRNKESRKRVMAANIARKKADSKQARDIENIVSLTSQAEEEADKLNGITKQRMLEENPPLPAETDAPVLRRIAGETVRNEKVCNPVALSTELSESMRNVKMPKANALVRDRFLSFERRGFIAPPKVLPKEMRRMARDKLREERKERRRRKGRGSASDLTFWRNGKRAVL
ncbi:Ribosome biogenesis protein Nop53/GLTSCR2 [Gracilaria domingensis]|nr:Ribosome biogenesis protein Nop53/GLTSCR2 [Gracilaria domingensis]